MSTVSLKNAEHYVWGEQCDGWHLLNSPGLSVIQEHVPAGAGEVRHYHRNSQQFFFVLSGMASIEIEDETTIVPAGQGLHVPAGKIHRLSNAHSELLEFLVISAPHSHGDRIDC